MADPGVPTSIPYVPGSGSYTIDTSTFTVDNDGCPVGLTTPAAALITPFVVPTNCPPISSYAYPISEAISQWGASCFLPNMRVYLLCHGQMDYYSPAVCPSGYSYAGPRISQGPAIASGESASMCCPVSWSLRERQCFDSKIVTKSPSTFLELISAYAIQVRWQSSDSSLLFAAKPVSTVVSSIASSSIPPAGSSSSTKLTQLASSTAVSKPRDPGMGTGAKAGIGAGIGVGVLAALAFLLFFSWRRKRKQKDNVPAYHAAATSGNDATQIVELPAGSMERKGSAFLGAPYSPESLGNTHMADTPPIAAPYVASNIAAPSPQTTHAELDVPHNALLQLSPQRGPSPLHPVYSTGGMLNTHTDDRWSNMEVAPVEGLEVVPQDPRNFERARIQEELSRIEARRQRLHEIHILESEEEQLRRRLQQL